MRVENTPSPGLGNTRYDLFKALHPASAIYPLTIYYDASCPLCQAEMGNLKRRDTGGLLILEDISAPDFARLPPGVTQAGLMALIHARKADGSVIKGMEVFRLAYGAAGIDWVADALRLPLVGPLAERLYPWIARHRHRHRQRFPRVLTRLLFEGPAQRAAEKAAAQARCQSGDSCRLPPEKTASAPAASPRAAQGGAR